MTNSFYGENVVCYCLQEFKTKAEKVRDIEFGDGSQPCKLWLDEYNLANNLTLVVSLMITLINAILKTTLKIFSKKEGHHTVSE